MKKEELIHFNWKYNYFSYNGLHLTSGETIEVIDPGLHNQNSGPDFFNAKIKIGNTIWAGNIEIHFNSSDWFNHGHNLDHAYDNVILHVVVKYDKPAINTKGYEINTLVIDFPDALEWNLLTLLGSGKWIPCADKIGGFDSVFLRSWLERLSVERLEHKSKEVLNLVVQTSGSWEEAFYRSISRSFGLVVNTLPFELLSRSTPLKVFAKQKDNLLQIEAILFGQAGFLSNINSDENYIQKLINEYRFLSKKYNLQPIDKETWKYLRMRPSTFPTIRIAQFANLIYKSSSLFSRIVETSNVEQINTLLSVKASEFWDTHYTFSKASPKKVKSLGKETIQIITLNTIIPFIFAYGSTRKDQLVQEKAIKLLESLKPEKNSITKGFEKLGVEAYTAFDSQAMVQLKTNYCDLKKCLYCHLGARLLIKTADCR